MKPFSTNQPTLQLHSFPLDQWFLNGGSFVPPSTPGHIWTCLETFLPVIWGVAVRWRHLEVEARVAAKHPTMHGMSPQQRTIWPKC